MREHFTTSALGRDSKSVSAAWQAIRKNAYAPEALAGISETTRVYSNIKTQIAANAKKCKGTVTRAMSALALIQQYVLDKTDGRGQEL
jgi:hypothetical protein